MSNRPATIRKTDIDRYIKSVRDNGLPIARVEFEGGKMVIYTSDNDSSVSPLEGWRRKNGQG